MLTKLLGGMNMTKPRQLKLGALLHGVGAARRCGAIQMPNQMPV